MGNKIYDRARDSRVHFKNTAGNKVTVNAVINVNTLLFESPQHIKTVIIKLCQAIFIQSPQMMTILLIFQNY